jgi:hypothetical protein
MIGGDTGDEQPEPGKDTEHPSAARPRAARAPGAERRLVANFGSSA